LSAPRRLLRLAVVGAALAAVVEAWLARRTAGAPPAPFASLEVIDAPIDRVWAALTDIERQPTWMAEMKAVRMTTPPPWGVGARGEATVRILGISVTDPVEITAFDAPHHFAVRHEGTFSGHGDIRLTAGADGTTTIVHWDETLLAPAVPHLWALVARPVMTAIFQADLQRFRRLVEAEG
jgi:uncharacterized membrane protein